jgi:hypothetical protein
VLFSAFHSSGYEEFCLLGYNVMYPIESHQIFQRNMLPPSSGLKSKQSKIHHEAGSKHSKWLAEMWNYIETEGNLETKQ